MKCVNGEALLVDLGFDTQQIELIVHDSSLSAPAVRRSCFML